MLREQSDEAVFKPQSFVTVVDAEAYKCEVVP